IGACPIYLLFRNGFENKTRSTLAIMGIIAVELILTLQSMGGYIKPVYSIELFFKAIGIALFVGIVGGLYPAFRAARLKPTEALRYE
ncbi:MAG: ABC transporter permease, partial [Methanobacterium sp.]